MRKLAQISIAILGACLLLGCRLQPWEGFPKATESALIMPPSPEKPRLAYVMEITKQEDLFKTRGVWKGFKEFFAGSADSRIVRPYALAIHPAGGLLIADPGKKIVHFYYWSRRDYVPIGPRLPGGLQSPIGVAVLPNGNILVCDSRLGTVECFDIKGTPLGRFCDPELLRRPAGIAVSNARSEVYISDVTQHHIAVFDLKGHLLRFIGERGDGAGKFNFPTHLALGPEGLLYVTDSMNFRVQVLEPDGTFVRSIGRLGDAPGQFSKPKGVAVDPEGHVIVVEALYGALEFFSPQGELLLSVGSSGSGPGQFWLPAGLCMDPEERLLFVADSYNSRVQVFRLLEQQSE
jgi:DNA-binding beta-propeller fold protein YncE